MSYSSRIPGNIALQNTGRNRLEEKGWRRFFLTDPRCRLQNDQGVTVGSNSAAPCTINEDTGNTVITFLAAHSGCVAGRHSMDQYVAGMPLRTDEGEILTFGKPFTLKTMIELISISGDHSDTDETLSHLPRYRTHPAVTMGLTAETGNNFANDTSRFIGSGVQIGARNRQSEGIHEDSRWLTEQTEDNSSGGQDRSAGGSSHNCILFVTEFRVGPDMSTSDGNTRILRQCFRGSGSNYAHGDSNTVTDYDGTDKSGFNDANTEVTIYAAISDVREEAFGNGIQNATSDNTPCVVTCRLWYMVEADYHNGWGGSGSA